MNWCLHSFTFSHCLRSPSIDCFRDGLVGRIPLRRRATPALVRVWVCLALVSGVAAGSVDTLAASAQQRQLEIGVLDGRPEYTFASIHDVEIDAAGRVWVLEGWGGGLRWYQTDGA